MSIIPTVSINLDAKCAECGKGGAAASGICLACTNRAIRGMKMKSVPGRGVQERWQQQAREMKAALGKR